MIFSICALCAIESSSVSRIAGVGCVRELHDAVHAPEGDEEILSSATTEWTSANFGCTKSERSNEARGETSQNLALVIIIDTRSVVARLMRSATTSGTP